MRLYPFILLTTFVLIHSTSSAQQQSPPEGLFCDRERGVVAGVSPGRSITLNEIDQTVSKQIQQLEAKIYALRKSALENLINRIVLETAARAQGLSLDELKRKLTPVETTISIEQIEDVYLENQPAFASTGEDEAKEKIRLDLESQARLRVFRTRVAELRGRTQVRICLDEPRAPSVIVSDRGPDVGPKDAPVTIYEYSDFQCPYCRQVATTIKRLLTLYDGKVRLVFKHLPLPMHPLAFGAAQGAYCAQSQGRFWPYHDRLFQEAALSSERLQALAVELGLDPDRFAECLVSDTSKAEVLKDIQEARKAGFSGTPTFVVNGRVLRGAISLEEFKRTIEAELGKRKED